MDIKSLWKEEFPTFTINSELSFSPLISWWSKRAKAPEDLYNKQIKKLLKELKDYPILSQESIDLDELLKDTDALSFIVNSLFPASIDHSKQLFMMSLPFSMDIIHASPLFKERFLCANAFSPSSMKDKKEEMYYSKLFNAYRIILKKFYDLEMKADNTLVYKVKDAEQITKYFYSEVNIDYVDVFTDMTLPDKETILKSCTVSTPCISELEKWQKLLPLDRFKFSGFTIIELKDFTSTESISELNNLLLKENDLSSPTFLEIVDQSVKSLLNHAKIKVGVAAFQKFDNKYLLSEKRLSNSYLIRQLCEEGCDKSYESVINFLSNVQDPVFLDDFSIGDCDDSRSAFAVITEMGVKEVIILPLKYEGNLVGVLEVCAEEKGTLNRMMLEKLKNINQPLAIALQKNMKQFEYQVQHIIRKNYTAIQPAIEWKFNEVAVQKILDQENGLKSNLQPVVFDQVYPLYAAVDIRNSSSTRLESIQRDLQQQLQSAKEIIGSAYEITPLPVLEKMKYKIQQMLDDIQLILVSDDESRINYFIINDIEPLFKHLQKVQPELDQQISAYFAELDPEIGLMYKNRNEFEQSLNMINQAVSQHIDKAQIEAQNMFPHYFEKYKTDGIDYNIYIGQSLVKDKVFDPIYLKNLKLWQLTTLCESAFISQSLREKLPLPLETTQLLLVHNSPLSISFRMDERKFDVEGAYNIRYEIMKKRIDKALIKNSKERLTQPGTISIIYSLPKEAEEYMDYIAFLQLKGLLGDKVENLDLDDLQGVNGLKAIRVNIGEPQFSEIPEFKSEKDVKTGNQK